MLTQAFHGSDVTETRRYSFSQMEVREDSEVRTPGCWQTWRGRIVNTLKAVGVAGTAVSLTVRICNFSHWSNAVANLGIGAGLEHIIELATPSEYLQKVRQLTMTLLGGQSIFFFATALYGNVPSSQEVTSSIAVATLGANLLMFGRWLWENHFVIRIESQQYQPDSRNEPLLPESRPAVFHGIFLNPNPKDCLRAIAAAGLAVGAAFTNDKTRRVLLGKWAAYYAGQVPADRFINRADKKIGEKEILERDSESTETKGSWWATAKIAFNSFGFIATPLLLVPFIRNQVYEVLTSAAVGCFTSGMNESLESRLKTTPIKNLEELQFCEETDSNWQDFWSIIFPAIVGTGLFSFGIWQIGWDLSSPIQRGAVGALLSGFVSAVGLANLIDHLWSRSKRIEQEVFLRNYQRKTKTTWDEDIQAFKIYALDKSFITFLLTQLFFGISPAIVLSSITTAMAMNNRAIEEEDKANKAIIVLGWFAYGFAWGLELVRTAGRRKGVEYRLVLLVVINGMLTFIRVGEGDV